MNEFSPLHGSLPESDPTLVDQSQINPAEGDPSQTDIVPSQPGQLAIPGISKELAISEAMDSGNHAPARFESLPIAPPPECNTEIHSDGILPPNPDVKKEKANIDGFKLELGVKLKARGCGQDMIDSVALCAFELIVNAKRYANGGNIRVGLVEIAHQTEDGVFVITPQVLVAVAGAMAHPPVRPTTETAKANEDGPFSETWDLASLELLTKDKPERPVLDLDPDEVVLAESVEEAGCVMAETEITIEGLKKIMVDAPAEHGRGLVLIAGMSANMGKWRPEDPESGYTVWCTVPVSRENFNTAA